MYGLNDIKEAKGIHIAHINVRSIANKWELLKINFMSANLHVLGLSETWLNGGLPNELYTLSNDYTLLRNDRSWLDDSGSQIKKGGGVAMYIKKNLDFSETSHSHLNTSNVNLESQWISIKQKNSKLILLGNVYRPPQGNIDAFIHVLETILSSLDLSKIELYIMGDINIDFNDKKNVSTKKIISSIKPYGLNQIIKNTTRYSRDKDSLIDVFITNSNCISNSGVCDVNISDHQMILLTRKRIRTRKRKCTFMGRSYRKYNKNEFQDRLRDADWESFDSSNDVTTKWDILIKMINVIIDVKCPLKCYKAKQEKEPWITPPLLELIKDKDNALKKAKRKKDETLWKEAKRLRNDCTKRLRNARADYIKENLENNQGNPKKFWKNIQNILPNKKKKSTVTFDLYNSKADKQVDNKQTADFINDFFVSIGPNLSKNNKERWNYYGHHTDLILEDIYTSIEEVINLCNNININKSSCIENLSAEVLRDAFLAVPEKITELLNCSFNSSIIPTSWKVAKVTPLQKPGNSKEVSNLRPVSLLPLPSKLIEKIVHNRIHNHCNTNKLLDKRQGGFRPNHSTTSTTAYFINDLYKAINEKQVSIAVFIDAMKAFDTVNHQILLNKLKYFGIIGKNYKWIENYLSERKQCTIANDIISKEKLITCGVPQGSVCGPLFFLLYINDISSSLKKCKVSLYADDTVLYISHNDVQIAARLVQQDLNLLNKWCKQNKVTINCKKTKYCVFGTRSTIKKSRNIDTIISLNENVLDRVCSYKYLGFILDDRLNFNRHISELCRIVTHKLYLLARIRRYITKSACITIFKSMILSLIEYGDIIYEGTTMKNLDDITKLFYRGLRICCQSNEKITKQQLCTECNISPLEIRREVHLLLFMHKQTCKKELLKSSKINTRLHRGPVFDMYKPNMEKTKQNIMYRGAITWNALSAENRKKEFTSFASWLKGNRYTWNMKEFY